MPSFARQIPKSIIFPIIGIASGEWLFLLIGGSLGGIFTALGVGMLYFSVRTMRETWQAYRLGEATTDQVVDVYRDTSIKVNGRSPWAIVYEFDVQGRLYEGTVRSWQRSAHKRKAGQPLHVLYIREDPESNTLYPPVK